MCACAVKVKTIISDPSCIRYVLEIPEFIDQFNALNAKIFDMYGLVYAKVDVNTLLNKIMAENNLDYDYIDEKEWYGQLLANSVNSSQHRIASIHLNKLHRRNNGIVENLSTDQLAAIGAFMITIAPQIAAAIFAHIDKDIKSRINVAWCGAANAASSSSSMCECCDVGRYKHHHSFVQSLLESSIIKCTLNTPPQHVKRFMADKQRLKFDNIDTVLARSRKTIVVVQSYYTVSKIEALKRHDCLRNLNLGISIFEMGRCQFTPFNNAMNKLAYARILLIEDCAEYQLVKSIIESSMYMGRLTNVNMFLDVCCAIKRIPRCVAEPSQRIRKIAENYEMRNCVVSPVVSPAVSPTVLTMSQCPPGESVRSSISMPPATAAPTPQHTAQHTAQHLVHSFDPDQSRT